MPATITDRLQGTTTSVAVKSPVRVATTANLTLSSLQTVNSIALAEGDRVLVKNQTDATQNGIWLASTSDWTRAADFDGARDTVQGTLVIVNTNSQGLIYRVTSANPITIGSSAINFAALVDPTQTFPLHEAEILAGVAPSNYTYPVGNALRYGCLADRTTANDAAFARLGLVAQYYPDIHIPAAQIKGYYYRITTTWTLTTVRQCTIRGDGDGSVIVIDNDGDVNAITINGCIHVTMKDLAIFGIEGSGNGLELDGGSHHFVGINLYSAFMDGAAFKVTWGISSTWINCRADRNIGYRPATLLPGMTEGRPIRAFHVTSRVDGQNNNPTFLGCQANACGDIVSCQFGDTGGEPVQSVVWDGGLIQGSNVGFELFGRFKDSRISAHIEPPVGEIAGNFCVALEGCTDSIIENCVVTGDIDLTSTCRNMKLEGINTCGIRVASTCVDTVIDKSTYANVATGATSGHIIDGSTSTILERLKNASNDRFTIGHSLKKPSVYFKTGMGTWVGGGSPTVPCGYTKYGTCTISRESTIKRTGSYSAKIILASDLAGGLNIDLLPANAFIGRRFAVEVWIYSSGSAGLGRITMLESGSSSYTEITHLQDTWERRVVTFSPSASATSVSLRLTGKIGTIYIADPAIYVDDFTPITEMTLDGTTTPTISYGGRPVDVALTSGTPSITTFLEPHVGVPFIVKGTSATVIVESSTMKLAGSGNFTFGVGDQMELVYGSDGVFTENGRTVV
jgi:hypothetical protein